MDIFRIDGSIGGGSVLRVSVPLFIANGDPVQIDNIRANRKKPGLRFQHLLGLQMIAKISGSRLVGASLGSKSIQIYPGEIEPQKCVQIQVTTAASISLINQIGLNYCIASKNDVSFIFQGGGTFTRWAPGYNYSKYVIEPMFKRLGIEITYDVINHGFYPKGGANGSVSIRYRGLDRFNFDETSHLSISLHSTASQDLSGKKVAERQLIGFGGDVSVHPHSKYYKTSSTGSSLTAVLHGNSTHGYEIHGERRIRAEEVGRKVRELVNPHLSTSLGVDEHLADQLLVPLAFAPKGSSFTTMKSTPHIETNLNLINSTLGKRINLQEENGLRFYN